MSWLVMSYREGPKSNKNWTQEPNNIQQGPITAPVVNGSQSPIPRTQEHTTPETLVLSDHFQSQRTSSQESRAIAPRSIDRPKLRLWDCCRFVALIWSALSLQVLLYLRSSWASRWREVWYLVFPWQMFITCSQASCRQSEDLNGFFSFLVSGWWSSWKCRVEVIFLFNCFFEFELPWERRRNLRARV